jgi:hypothetical protein
MDIHQQLLGVAGKLRAGASQAPEAVAGTLTEIADRIDPNVYAPAESSILSAETAINGAIADLDVIPDSIRPTSVPPMRAELRDALDRLSRTR